MTNLKISSKLHLFIIISSIVVAIGLALGLVFHFVSDSYFDYGEEYKSYKSVVVSYAYVDLSNFGDEKGIEELCDAEFKSAGVSYYSSTRGETSGGGEITFKFSQKAGDADLEKAASAIHAKLTADKLSGLSNAYVHEATTLKGGENGFIYAAIAVASAIAFQFIYFAIRYKLTMALAALLADIHNVAIFVSLAAITRVPVGSSIMLFGVLAVLMTMIGCCFLFDNMRKSLKDEEFAKLSAFEQVDKCAAQSLFSVSVVSVIVAVAAAVMLVVLAIGAMSVSAVLSPAVLAVLSAASCVYGTAFFTPAVYSRFKKLGENFKKQSKKSTKK